MNIFFSLYFMKLQYHLILLKIHITQHNITQHCINSFRFSLDFMIFLFRQKPIQHFCKNVQKKKTFEKNILFYLILYSFRAKIEAFDFCFMWQRKFTKCFHSKQHKTVRFKKKKKKYSFRLFAKISNVNSPDLIVMLIEK